MANIDTYLTQIRDHELRRNPKQIRGVQFVFHNGDHYMYRCKHAEPMIQMATTLKEIIKKRNDGIRQKMGPFILEGMNWKNVPDVVAFIKKIFYEVDGKIYWNVTYITPKTVSRPGDSAESFYKYGQVKFMGRTFMSHSIVWMLLRDEFVRGIIHTNGDNHDNRIKNLHRGVFLNYSDTSSDEGNVREA